MVTKIGADLPSTNTTCAGAAVLAHSLRDNGSKGKLVAFYTPDTLKDSTIQELKVILIPHRK
jgi:hypothetical protein